MQPILKVIDLSHHNDGPHDGEIDFELMAQPCYMPNGTSYCIKGVIHKSSQGIGNVDAQYALRRKAAMDAGLLWGAYHFADSSDPQAQVDHFLSSAKPDDTTLMALDFEPNGGNTMTLDDARAFLHAIEDALGRKAVLYSGNLIKEKLGANMDAYLGAHRLWLAHYNDVPRWPPAWHEPWLHQFSGDGVNNHNIEVPGVNFAQRKQLDMNSFTRSDEELAAEWAT